MVNFRTFTIFHLSKIVHLPALKEGDMLRRKPDIGKMRHLLNRELTSIESGIEKILEEGLALYNPNTQE